MNIEIRQEQPADYLQVEQMTRKSFGILIN